MCSIALQVIGPIINAALNQEKWPETVVADVKQNCQEICGVLYSMQGQLKGGTLLPMPFRMEVITENEERVLHG